MKCKTCKMRMSDVLINLDYECNGMAKKAVNVPACKCPKCNNVVVPDLVMGKLEAFAEWEKSNIVDYAKCEQNEAEIFTVLHIFGNL